MTDSKSNITRKPLKPHWLAKTLAGSLLGLSLALACSGLFLVLTPNMAPSLKSQLAMWLVAPVWLSVFSTVYLFRNGWQAWLWLGLANLLAIAAVALFSWLSL